MPTAALSAQTPAPFPTIVAIHLRPLTARPRVAPTLSTTAPLTPTPRDRWSPVVVAVPAVPTSQPSTSNRTVADSG